MKPIASVKTGLSVTKGQLFYHGQKMQTVSKQKLFEDFLNYLQNVSSVNSSDETLPITLVGQNVLR